MRLQNKVLATSLVGLMASTSAFAAQLNNTGEIVINGVVPGYWELSVSDLNAGYDFDFSDTTVTQQIARVGSIHITSNDVGASTTTEGLLFVESVNSGRMINPMTVPGNAGEHVDYTVTLSANTLVTNSVAAYTAPTPGFTNSITLGTAFDLLTPRIMGIGAAPGAGATQLEGLFNVDVTLEDTSAAGNMPVASGVYSDTIIFTIMDGN